MFLASSCNHGSNQTIDIAYHLAAFAPDSALSLLQGMRGTTLSLEEQARYALVYTMAQDKSGLDVDNDSLLRAAYTYYIIITDLMTLCLTNVNIIWGSTICSMTAQNWL